VATGIPRDIAFAFHGTESIAASGCCRITALESKHQNTHILRYRIKNDTIWFVK